MKWNIRTNLQAGEWLNSMERRLRDFALDLTHTPSTGEMAAYVIQCFLEDKPPITLCEETPARETPQKREEFLVRLEQEREDLKENYEKLSKFLGSPACAKLPHHHQMLLADQSSVMARLLGILDQRLSILHEEERAADALRAAQEELNELRRVTQEARRMQSRPELVGLLDRADVTIKQMYPQVSADDTLKSKKPV